MEDSVWTYFASPSNAIKKWIFIVFTNYEEQLFSMNTVILPTIAEQSVN